MLCFGVISVALAFSPLSRFLIYLLPLGSFVLAHFLLHRDEGNYVGFVCWLYILTPFIRRVVDYHTGSPETTIMLAPFLATVACVFKVLARWSEIFSSRSAPVLYVLGAIAYASMTSMVHMQITQLAEGMIFWLAPIIFGFYLYLERGRQAALYTGFERAMVGGTLVAGLYGILQFIVLPPWDREWMDLNHLVSLGPAEPLTMRVFSTMNAPQVLGAFLVVGILVTFRLPGRVKFFAIPSAVAALGFSMSRSAWLALAAGVLYFCFRLTSRERVRLIVLAACCAMVLAVAAQTPDVHDALDSRFRSLTDVKYDESASDRAETYGSLIQGISKSPFGLGIGVESEETGASVSDAEHDSTIVNMLLSLGILGSFVFTFGVGTLFFRILTTADNGSAGLISLQASLIALATEAALNNVLTGPIAFLTWSAIGLGYAGLESGRPATVSSSFATGASTSQERAVS
jgi:hypothetical protein